MGCPILSRTLRKGGRQSAQFQIQAQEIEVRGSHPCKERKGGGPSVVVVSNRWATPCSPSTFATPTRFWARSRKSWRTKASCSVTKVSQSIGLRDLRERYFRMPSGGQV